MSPARLLAASCLAAVTVSAAPAPIFAAVPPAGASIHERRPDDAHAVADVPWVIAVVATQARVAPAALLGLRPDEVVHVDADDPAQVDLVARALERWGSPVVLVVADGAQEGRVVQKTLLQQCQPLRAALADEGTFLELVTVGGNSGAFTFRGPHPQAANLLRTTPAELIPPPTEGAPTADEKDGEDEGKGEAILAAGAMGADVAAAMSLPAIAPQQPVAAPTLTPSLAAAPSAGSDGNLLFALSGLMLAVGVVLWTNRARLFPDGLPAVGSWMGPRLSGPAKKTAMTAPTTASGPRFHSSNVRLSAAVNRLYENLQQRRGDA